MDEQIPQTVRWYLQSMAKIIGVVLYISIVTPLFILGLVPICAFYVIAQRFYIKTSRELTRLDSIRYFLIIFPFSFLFFKSLLPPHTP